VSEAVIDVAKVVGARDPWEHRSTQAGMELRPGHRKNEFPVGPQQARHLPKHGLDLLDVLEHRIGENPIKAGVSLRHTVTPDGMNCRIDPKLSRLRGLRGVGIDSDHLARPGSLQDDPREQPVTTAEVKAAALWQTVFHKLINLDSPPKRRRGLERVLVKKSDEQVAIQRSSSSSCAS